MAVLQFLFSIVWALRQAVQVIRYFFFLIVKTIRKISSTNKFSFIQYACWELFFSLHFDRRRPLQVSFKHAALSTSLPPVPLSFLSLKRKWCAIKPGCYIWCNQTSQVDSIMILITTLSITWWQVDTWGLCPAILFSSILLLHCRNSNMIRVNVTMFCLLLIWIWYMYVVYIFFKDFQDKACIKLDYLERTQVIFFHKTTHITVFSSLKTWTWFPSWLFIIY